MQSGLTFVGDACQCKLGVIFSKLNFVTGLAGDMIIWGEEAAGSVHGYHPTEFLCLKRQCKLMFNCKGVQYRDLKWVQLSQHSHSYTPEDNRMSVIAKMPKPSNTKELKYFLEIINFLNKYSTKLAGLSSYLRDLAKKNSLFLLQTEHM